MNKRRLLIIVGIIAVIVVLVVVFDTTLANHLPAIAGIEAWERIVPNGKCEIVCIASDRDGDALSYTWSASGGNISGTGMAVNWTAPNSLGSCNVTVTVTDGRGGEDIDYVTIEVRPNTPPTISSLVADGAWTLPSGSLQVMCTASDPDGDSLTYEWMAAAGEAVNWTAPQEVGIHNVTVVVKDGHGSSATRNVLISVATGQPPTIEELLVTADHCYLKTYSWGYKVGKKQEYHVECVVADTSAEVSYNWSCSRDGGEISGEGSMITWTAPNPSGSTDVTVTVIVTDVVGNMAAKDVSLNVVNCSPCTFGC